jgi:tripartite-type tricarboxylate transporter receptor subunit TctC
MPNRREVLRGGAALPAALAAATLIPEALRAQAFPARTITIVAPFPPGGVADYAARPLAAFLGTKFGKNVVVDNRPGAGGGVGHAYVARAEPDGHTIMCSLPSLAVIPEANRLQGRPVNYEMADFVPLARLFADPVLLVVKKEAKWRLERFPKRLSLGFPHRGESDSSFLLEEASMDGEAVFRRTCERA